MQRDKQEVCLQKQSPTSPPTVCLSYIFMGFAAYVLSDVKQRTFVLIALRFSFDLYTEVEFLEEIQTEVLRVFLLAIHRHLY